MNTLHAPLAPRRVRTPLLAACALAAAVLAAGCTNARLTNVWRDPSYSHGPLQAMLVVSRDGDATQRRLVEDAVAAQVRQAGLNAVCAYTLFADTAPSQGDMTSAMRDRDLDGALVIKPLKAETETEYVPGWNSVEPRTYYDPWRERPHTVIVQRHHSGYHVVDRIQRLQLTLWAGEGKPRMVWAGTLEDENPGSRDRLRDDLAQGIVPGLRQAGFVDSAHKRST